MNNFSEYNHGNFVSTIAIKAAKAEDWTLRYAQQEAFITA